MTQDQKQHWNKLHEAGKADHYLAFGEPTEFALEVQSIITPHTSILELGCGAGNDSIFFANKGHKVCATDFSEVAIEKNKDLYKHKDLTFDVLDISKPMPYENGTFDVVYARLSLHYFTDKVTKEMFQEIRRILKPSGYICFLCKSIKDSLYGKGKKIEEDLFEYNGHIRHFFSEEYVKECLKDTFTIHNLESGEENFYGRDSAFIKVIAKAKSKQPATF